MIKIAEEDIQHLRLGDTVYRYSYFGKINRKIRTVAELAKKDKLLKCEKMHIYHIKDDKRLQREFVQLYCISIKSWSTDFIHIDECSLTIFTYIKIQARRIRKFILARSYKW